MLRFLPIIIASSSAVLASCESHVPDLRLVTPSESIDSGIISEFGNLLDEDYTVGISLTEYSLAEGAALDMLVSGSADLALVSNNLPYREDVATVMPLYPTVLHIAYRYGLDATSAESLLRGAAVYAGPEGSASRLVFERIVARQGLDADDYAYVSEAGPEPDVLIVFAPISPERIAAFPDFRLFSLATPAEIGTGSIVDAALLLNPQFRPFVVPQGTYGDATPEAIVTVAVDKLLIARSDLDSSIVYDLINDILRLRPAMAARHPGLFSTLGEDFDVSRSNFEIHTGTQDYLQRSAPTVYERYSGVAEVAVTLFIGLFSASVAGVRIFKMRRKNRIDTFYSKTLQLRKSVSNSMPAEDRKLALQAVRNLQNEAFDLLVDEKLAADESFRIFITLSNDVIRQLGGSADYQRSSDA
jgi:hypothetical protein